MHYSLLKNCMTDWNSCSRKGFLRFLKYIYKMSFYKWKTMNLCIHLLDQIDSWLQIKSEIDEFPLHAFLLVFFLLQDKYSTVEKLL